MLFRSGFYRSQLVNGGSLWTEFEELSSASASEEEFKSFYDKVSETVVAAEVTRSYMLELTELVNIANELEGLEYPGSDELYEATGIALSFYMSEDATLEDLQGAIADMNKAIFDYKLSVTVNATDANPSDITSIIINSTLEAGVTSAYSVPTGWNCSNSGGNDKFVYIPEDGSASFEAWSGNPANMNFDYYQEITGLPTGIYTLKANARSCDGDEPNGNAVIYASAENEKTASVFNPLVNGTGAVATEMSEYEVKGVFVANGTLRIGAKNIGALSSQWTIYDDFQLFFHGNEAGLENFKSALSDRIVEAE